MTIQWPEFSGALNSINGSILEEPKPEILSLETNSNVCILTLNNFV